MTSYIIDKKVDRHQNETQFILRNVDLSFANAIRREILGGNIDVVGILTEPEELNEVEILKNTGRMHNEMLKHRLSAIPIHIQDYVSMDISKYKIVLQVKNDTNHILDVTSKDIKIYDMGVNAYVNESERNTIFPANSLTKDYILLTRLYPRKNSISDVEEIHLEAPLSLRKSSESSVYNTTSTCSYGFVIDPVKQKKAWEDHKKTLSNVEDMDFEKKNWYVHEGRRHYKENQYQFKIESVGVYSNDDIVKKACYSLNQKLDILLQEPFDIKKGNTVELSYDVIIPNDNYTIGKIIENACYNLFYKEKAVLSFIGYNKVHPHVNYGIIRMMFHKEEYDENYIQNILPQAIQYAKTLFTAISNQI
jgi:hypothetical protein